MIGDTGNTSQQRNPGEISYPKKVIFSLSFFFFDSVKVMELGFYDAIHGFVSIF